MTEDLTVALGIGCDRGTPEATIAQAVDEALAAAGADLARVAAVASITLKADEPGLLALAARHGWTIRFHAPATLAAVEVPNPSETVRRHTGTPSVSEAAALLAAGAADASALLVEKHKHRGADGRNATVSVARMSAPARPPRRGRSSSPGEDVAQRQEGRPMSAAPCALDQKSPNQKSPT